MIILSLIQNIALLIALAATYQVIGSGFEKKSLGHRVLSGLLFGGVGLVAMMTPLNFAPGIIFDGRSIILSVAGLFGGPLVAATAATMCGAYRLWLGGAGAWVGVSVIVESAALGTVFYFLWKGAERPITAFSLYIFGLLVHVIMLVIFLALPAGAGIDVLRKIGLPILIVYPFATLLVCRIFLDYETQIHERNSLRKSEEKYRTIFEESFDGLFITSPGGKILDMNKKGVEMFGYETREEILSLDLVRDVYAYPQDRLRILSMVNEQGTAEYEVVVKKKGGEEMITYCSLTAARDEKGVIASYRGIIRDITELVRVRLRLENERVRLRTLVQTIPDLVWLKDPDGIYLTCNPRFERFFGAKESEIVGKTDYDFVDAELAEFFIEQDRKAMEAGKPSINEEWVTFADDGHRELLETIKTPMYDNDGNLVGVLGIARNITAAKQAEEALLAASVYNRNLIEASLDPLVTISPDGKITDVNRATELATGYSRDELIGTDFTDYFADAQKAREGYQRAFHEGTVKDYELDIRHRTGHLTPVVYNASVYHNRSGEIAGLFAAARDISRRKEAEEKNALLAAIVEYSDEAIIGKTLDGKITSWNKGATSIYGYQDTEVLGKSISILVPPNRQDEIPHFLERVKRGEHLEHYHTVRRKKDGLQIDVSITISPIRNAEGTITGASTIARDITEQNSTQRQLFQAQKMESIGTLAGGVAHDFNNILQVTLGYSELILSDEGLPQQYRDDLQKIHQSAKRGADLVQRLLTFSRKTEIKPQPLNLNLRIFEMRKMLERTIPKMIDIQLFLSEDPSIINADPIQMDQVLMNLAVNASHAMPDGGKLTIETQRINLDEQFCRLNLGAKPGDYVMLSVSDTGHGMDHETLTHIFEPFFTTKETGQGTGLGLAMVYGIVKQHDGYITCSSELGEGTTFRIYLPTIPSEVTPETASDNLVLAKGTETLLLVDDEEYLRDLGKRILERYGYSVMTATNGKEALDSYNQEREKISLVILDLIMPEMGGKQCLEELLKIDAEARVLIASGFAANGQTKEVLAKGARGFITKPYNMRDVLQTVREVLDQA